MSNNVDPNKLSNAWMILLFLPPYPMVTHQGIRHFVHLPRVLQRGFFYSEESYLWYDEIGRLNGYKSSKEYTGSAATDWYFKIKGPSSPKDPRTIHDTKQYKRAIIIIQLKQHGTQHSKFSCHFCPQC